MYVCTYAMDYSIGSISDLISGSNTPNKQKVVKKMKSKPLKKENEQTTVSNDLKILKKKVKRKRCVSPKSKQNKHLKLDENSRVKSEELDKSSSEKVIKNKTNINSINNNTTVFVGNLPISITQHKLKKIFAKFGNIKNARIRSVPVANLKIPKKVAAIKKQFHPDRKSLNGYVSFESVEDAQKALSFNGKEYKGHHIRVNMCNQDEKHDKTRAIFLGNVSFDAEEEELWKLFESCGEIESVRLIRDPRTDVGKGFGYVNFKSADSVELALQMGDVSLKDRVLRISLYNSNASKKQKTSKPEKQLKYNNINKQQNKEISQSSSAVIGQFQGKIATEKKKKFTKGNQQKKKLAKKIIPKALSG